MPVETTPMHILTNGSQGLLPDHLTPRPNEEMVVTSITAVKAVSAVPKPSTYAMLPGGPGLVGFVARRRRGKV